MAVSRVLESSAKNFSTKYACNFDFATFEAKVEEFTFLRPNGGWIDVYKAMFDRVYKKALEKAAFGVVRNLDGEAMLDDFEYTLIRPYVTENSNEIKHRPYVGMDRMARLEYLDRLTKEAPSNSVDLYTEQYKKRERTLEQMKSVLSLDGRQREQYVALAGYVEALEITNKGRTTVWRVLHPVTNHAEKRDAALMKTALAEELKGRDETYADLVKAAYATFDGHQRANENLAERMARAREESNRQQKMSDAIRESFSA